MLLKHLKSVLAQLFILKLISRPTLEFWRLKNAFFCFVYSLIEPEIQPTKTLYLWLGTSPPVKP